LYIFHDKRYFCDWTIDLDGSLSMADKVKEHPRVKFKKSGMAWEFSEQKKIVKNRTIQLLVQARVINSSSSSSILKGST
jgi:hypothetical protein